MLYCAFFVKESKTNYNKEKIEIQMTEKTQDDGDQGKELEAYDGTVVKTKGRMFCEMFQFENLKQGVASVLKKRGHYKRSLILLLIFGFELEIVFLGGYWSSHFFYLR